MSETRVRGQELTVRLAQQGRTLNAITAFKDFTFQYETVTMKEGYLGETTMRVDDIFNGVSGSFGIAHEGQEVLLMMDFIRERAQRKRDVNQAKINATVTLTFPNGDRPRVLIPDMKFGPMPVGAASREAYVETSFTFETSTARVITT